MQDPGEDNTGGRTGVDEGGEGGQHRPQAADAQASSQSLATEGGHDNSPRESGPQDAGSQAAPGSSRPGSPGVSGVSAEEAAIIPQDEQVPLLPGPSGDGATTASQLLELRWTTEDPVLFRISINNFLDQLSLVMRNIRHLQFVAFKQRRERRHNN